MEVSMHMNHSLIQNLQKTKPFSSRKPISCELAMQNGNKTNFYQLLSLKSQNAGFDEIKKAYKSMALQYHPDVCTSPLTKHESTQRFIELRKAYETLSNPQSRQVYDFELGLQNKTRIKVWEKQLHGLRRRCDERIKIKKYEN